MLPAIARPPHSAALESGLDDGLGRRFDWAAADRKAASDSTSEPDGHPKQVLVYFLTRDEPQFVAAEEAFQQAKKARKEAMRAFFERLP